MRCPKCGVENADDAQSCRSCGAALAGARVQTPRPISKTSGLAIASFVVALLSIVLFPLGAAAMVLGIAGLIVIEKSGGRLTGRPFAILGIVLPVCVFFVVLAFLIPALNRFTNRVTCTMNLSAIGRAMHYYANDYDDEFPRAGPPATDWGPQMAAWDTPDRHSAFGGQIANATISSSLYLLVKYEHVTPNSFICKGDVGATEFKLADYPNRNASCRELTDAWDFGGPPGPHPTTHCSYSYHQPYGLYALTSSSEPGMAVAADRNPFIKSPVGDAVDYEDFGGFVPDLPPAYNGSPEQARISNAIVHQKDGQNVLFVDGHVAFEKRAFCGIENDNIYTYTLHGSVPPTNPVGEFPLPHYTQAGSTEDSFLVHDDPTSPPPYPHRRFTKP